MALLLLPAVRWSRNERDARGALLIAQSRVPAPVSARRPGLLSGVRLFGEELGQGAVAAAHRKQESSRATATIVTLCGLPRARIDV
jgi:hypothetical protein